MNYETVKERIDPLIDSLSGITTSYSVERLYIGEAMTLLRLLKDILESRNEK
jgi:hypothetical protein